MDITGNISVVAWIKFEAKPSVEGDEAGSVSKGFPSSSWGYNLEVQNNADQVRFRLSSSGSSSAVGIGASSLNSGVWCHVAAVYNGTDIRIYLDGSLDENGTDNPKAYTAGIFNNSTDFHSGRRSDGGDEFDGLIDEVAVFDRALSASEVNDIFTNGLAGAAGAARKRLIVMD